MNALLTGERILVVDDEESLRRTLHRFLASQGAEVRLAENSAAAITLLEDGQQIHKVVTDIDMPPGRSGIWLIEQIRRRWPAIHVVVTTGSPLPPEKSTGADAVLLKPYRFSDLISCLRH